MRGFVPELHLPESPLPWLAWLRRQGYDFGTDVAAAYRPAGAPAGRGPTYAPTRFKAGHTITAFLTDALLDFIAVRRDTPWFAHAAHIRPHPPFIAPEPYNTHYRPEDMPLPRRAATPEIEGRQHPLLRYYLDSQPQSRYFGNGAGLVRDLSDADLAQLRATYCGMVTEVDDQIGRLVAQLKAWDLYEDTLIVVTSDHGEMLGDHFLLSKEGYFAEAYHVPLIVRDPRPAAAAARGGTFAGFAEAVDIMPTLLEWMGLPQPRQCDGRSLLPLCRGEPADWRREVHWEFDFRNTWTPGAEAALGVGMDACGLAVLRDERHQYVHCAGLPPLFRSCRRPALPGQSRRRPGAGRDDARLRAADADVADDLERRAN